MTPEELAEVLAECVTQSWPDADVGLVTELASERPETFYEFLIEDENTKRQLVVQVQEMETD